MTIGISGRFIAHPGLDKNKPEHIFLQFIGKFEGQVWWENPLGRPEHTKVLHDLRLDLC